MATLNEVEALTQKIRKKQQDIADLSEERRNTVMQLRQDGVTYKRIADAMNVTQGVVYRIMRKGQSGEEN